MEWTPLPVGVDNFEEIITKGYYYVDKTLLIKDLIDLRGKVNLFTRPRRFGKTLNMSMVRYFFEKSDEDRSRLFCRDEDHGRRRKISNGIRTISCDFAVPKVYEAGKL